MNNFADFPPALILLLGALLVPFLKPSWRSVYVILLPLATLFYILQLKTGTGWQFHLFTFTEEPLEFLRVDKLARAFGIIFSLNAVAAFIYAFYYKKSTQHVAALFYIGGAIGTVFAGDLLTMYVFWESMAVSSTFVILARNTEEAKGAAFRYIMIHLVGGLLLLAGVILTIAQQGGSIAFDGFDFETANHAGTWLILIGILVNCGAPPLSAWLPDSYPAASVTGGLILSAYTTKTAVYTLLRGYPGWEPLIWIGCAMAVYGVIYALMESDIRRILAYAIINQVGFMVCAAGVGTNDAISGATAAAFCHILYKSLLWMTTGAVLYRLGKTNLRDLGGLHRTMPVTTIFFLIGCLSMALPGTCGFTSKNIIIHAIEHEHLFWPWLLLEISAVGIFLAVAIRLPYFLFFGKDKGLTPQDAPHTMIGGMALLGFFCLFFGLAPQPLYDLLPHAIDYHPYSLAKVTIVLQWILAAGIAFIFLKKWLTPKPGLSLDFDWFYRKGAAQFYRTADTTLNGANALAKRLFLDGFVKSVCNFFESGASRSTAWLMTPVWMLHGHNAEEIDSLQQSIFKRSKRGAYPIGITAFCAVILLGLLSIIFLLE